MEKFKTYAYLIECLTNLHVGSGDNNYGVVDKQVQRDPVTNTPIIHASSLKGALREYFEKGEPQWGEDSDKINQYFGTDKKPKGEKMSQGALRIFDARLLSIPVRGTNDTPFYRATSCELVNEFNQLAKSLCAVKPVDLPSTQNTNANTEHGDFTSLPDQEPIGKKIVKINTDVMQENVFRHLPIIARNSLENGQSENLWYEEIVPRKSRFYFFIALTDKKGLNEELDFENDINAHLHDKVIQIGANATVGYGYCKITKIEKDE